MGDRDKYDTENKFIGVMSSNVLIIASAFGVWGSYLYAKTLHDSLLTSKKHSQTRRDIVLVIMWMFFISNVFILSILMGAGITANFAILTDFGA